MRRFLIILMFFCCLASASGQNTAPSAPAASEEESSSSAIQGDVAPTNFRRPALDLDHLRVLELSEQEGLDWRRDWWKYLLMTLSGALCLLLLVHITNLLLRVIGVFICISGGILGAILIAPRLNGWLPQLIPEDVAAVIKPELICLLLGGLCGYILAAAVLALIRKPARKEQKKNA